MKKIISLLCAFVILAGLCACGGNTDNPINTSATSAPVATAPGRDEITEPDKSETAGSTEITEPAENTEPAESTETVESTVADNKSLAISCIDKSVEELYAMVGEPNETDYVPSCLMEGGDGMLIYDEFIVYTYRLNGEETVIDVE